MKNYNVFHRILCLVYQYYKNPYNIKERKKFIEQKMHEWIGRYEITVIPDITRVCYGRGVGWDIREIHLDEKTEKISATDIRKQKNAC